MSVYHVHKDVDSLAPLDGPCPIHSTDLDTSAEIRYSVVFTDQNERNEKEKDECTETVRGSCIKKRELRIRPLSCFFLANVYPCAADRTLFPMEENGRDETLLVLQRVAKKELPRHKSDKK